MHLSLIGVAATVTAAANLLHAADACRMTNTYISDLAESDPKTIGQSVNGITAQSGRGVASRLLPMRHRVSRHRAEA